MGETAADEQRAEWENYFRTRQNKKSLKFGKYIACLQQSWFVILDFSVMVIKENCKRLEVCELWWVMGARNLNWNKVLRHSDIRM